MSMEKIGGIRMSVESAGERTPTLILLHGGLCDRHDWQAQVQALAPRFRVVTLDLPGHGESETPAEGSMEALARPVCEIKQRYADGPVVLIGHSMGTCVAMEVLRQSPAAIAGLILIEGHTLAMGPAAAVAEALQAKWREMGLQEFVTKVFAGMFTENSDPAQRRHVAARMFDLDWQFVEKLFLGIAAWQDKSPRILASIEVPVLALQSTQLDANFKFHSLRPDEQTHWGQVLVKAIAHAQAKTVPGVGHFTPTEAPEIVNRHILDFIERL